MSGQGNRVLDIHDDIVMPSQKEILEPLSDEDEPIRFPAGANMPAGNIPAAPDPAEWEEEQVCTLFNVSDVTIVQALVVFGESCGQGVYCLQLSSRGDMFC